MNEEKQIQKELFEEFTDVPKRRFANALFFRKARRTATFSYEHLLFMAIMLMIVGILLFVLGVERGKGIGHEGPSAISAGGYKEAEAGDNFSQAEEGESRVGPKQEKARPEEEKAKADTHKPKAEDLKTKTEHNAPQQKDRKDKSKAIYIILVASYAKEDGAKKVVDKLSKEGIKSSIKLSGKYYIVYIGEFKSKSAADSKLKKIRKIYPDSYVKKR